jgi:predicted  nucleic acid-binding Zn-ribbon protein
MILKDMTDSRDIQAMQRRIDELEDRRASTENRAVRAQLRQAIQSWKDRIETAKRAAQ